MYETWPQIIELLFSFSVTLRYENILTNIGQIVKELTFWLKKSNEKAFGVLIVQGNMVSIPFVFIALCKYGIYKYIYI